MSDSPGDVCVSESHGRRQAENSIAESIVVSGGDTFPHSHRRQLGCPRPSHRSPGSHCLRHRRDITGIVYSHCVHRKGCNYGLSIRTLHVAVLLFPVSVIWLVRSLHFDVFCRFRFFKVCHGLNSST